VTRFVLVAAVLAAGCIDDFDPASLVTEPRVLGAKVEVEGNAAAAWVRAGQAGAVRWLVVSSAEARPLTWAFLACAAVPASTNVAVCAGEPFALTVRTDPVVGMEPTLPFVVPTEGQLAGAPAMLVVGVVCADGIPVLAADPRRSGCEGPETKETIVALTVPIARGADYNAHPVIETAMFGDAPWDDPPDPLPFEECGSVDESSGLPHVALGALDVELAVVATAGSFEEVPDDDFDVDREALLLSSFTTTGTLERQFTLFEEGARAGRIGWTPPSVGAVGGVLVQLTFVARDRRGGIDWIRRAACVVP
jgi:hypothetical protein